MSDQEKAQAQAADRTLTIKQLDDDAAAIRVGTDLKNAKKEKDKDYERNQAYRNIYLNLDPPDSAIAPSGAAIGDKRLYSNTSLPFGAAMVDSGAAQLYNTMFPNENYFDLDADDWQDDLFAERVTAHMMKQHREMQFRYRIYQALQESLCFDYAITLLRWRIEPTVEDDFAPEIEEFEVGGYKGRYRKHYRGKRYRFGVDRPDLQLINFFRCAHDKQAPNLEESTFFIDWRDEPIWRLKMMEKNDLNKWGKYKNIDQAIAAAAESDNRRNDEIDPADTGQQNIIHSLEVTRYWSPPPVGHVVEVAGGVVISRFDISYWPLQCWKTYPVPGEFRGMGLLERAERSLLDINAIINNRRNVQNFVADPLAAISVDLLAVGEDEPQVFPGRTFKVKRGNPKDKIWVYEPPAGNDGSINEMSIQLNATKESVGFGGDLATGQFTAGDRTAREVTAVQSGLQSRSRQVALNHEENCLCRIYATQFVMNRRFLSVEDTFKYMGKDGQRFLRVLPGDYRFNKMPRFTPKGSSYTIEREFKLAMIAKGTELALMAPQHHNLENVLAYYWELLVPHDFHQFIKDPRDRGYKLPPALENVLFAMGHDVGTSPEDDDREHIAVHRSIETTKDYQLWPQVIRDKHTAHIREHEARVSFTANARRGIVNPQQDESDVFRGLRA